MLSPRTACFVLAVGASSVARADDADPVIVRVGSAVLRASDVQRRILAVPAFQLASFGKTPEEIRKRFVSSVLAPEMLYAAEAEQRRLAMEPQVLARIRDARSRALVDAIRGQAVAAGIPEGEIQAYFAAHRDEFEKPERIRIARILTDDESLARRILVEARGAGGPERWSKLAREHSVDDATKMRGGSLGFVFPDGRTEVPQLRVDAALFAAAAAVKDGELVPNPVKEGNRFAVVWRRGTLPAVHRTLDEERDRIREILLRTRIDQAVTSLLDALRKQYVTKVDSAALESPLPSEASSATTTTRPREPTSADPVPKPTDRGLR